MYGDVQKRHPEKEKQDILRLTDINPQSAEVLQRRYVEECGKYMTLPAFLHELLQLCAAGYVKQVGGSYFARCME